MCNVDTMGMLTQYNIRNNGEKPQQNTLKKHCEKALGNVTAKPKQNHGKTSKKYAEGMQNTTKK